MLVKETTKKVGYYSLQFHENEDYYFKKEEFRKLLELLKTEGKENLIYVQTISDKAISVESIDNDTIDGKEIYIMIFKSCKFNHNRNYMSSVTGDERESDKKSEEGEKEITHVILHLSDDECVLIKEELHSGVSISNIKNYLNNKIEIFSKNGLVHFEEGEQLIYSMIQSEEFLEMLRGTKRIVSLDLTANVTALGSSFFNNSTLGDSEVQEDATLTIKAQRKKNLSQDFIEDMFNKVVGREIRRIKVRAKDSSNNEMILDSLNTNLKKYLTVNTDEKGVVVSSSIIPQMKQLMRAFLYEDER